MPSANLDLVISERAADPAADSGKSPAETQEPITPPSAVQAQESITSLSAVPLITEKVKLLSSGFKSILTYIDAISVRQGCDLSGLLTFDPDSIAPAPSMAINDQPLGPVLPQLRRLKTLLTSPIETLVDDPEEVKSILAEIQDHLPVALQVKLWPVAFLSLYKSRVQSARQRIDSRHAQLPLRADIAEKCQRLNEKKAALDAKTDTSVSTADLETLRKELEAHEERVRATKQLIHDKEAFIARSKEEATNLKIQLQTDLAEIHVLTKQLVTGKDEDDEAEIAEVDRVRADALHAFEAFFS